VVRPDETVEARRREKVRHPLAPHGPAIDLRACVFRSSSSPPRPSSQGLCGLPRTPCLHMRPCGDRESGIPNPDSRWQPRASHSWNCATPRLVWYRVGGEGLAVPVCGHADLPSRDHRRARACPAELSSSRRRCARRLAQAHAPTRRSMQRTDRPRTRRAGMQRARDGATCSMQRAACNMQHATCSTQRATMSNEQRATCSMQLATACNV
jgi:hypothetical protein